MSSGLSVRIATPGVRRQLARFGIRRRHLRGMDAFVVGGGGTIYLVRATERNIVPLLNHEVLHQVLARIGHEAESDAFDRTSVAEEGFPA